MVNYPKEQKVSRKLSREAFINEDGAIDLASIMVGIIVIGIIGGVIAATVFAVIPWSQDKAAKSALDTVDTAQSAHAGFAAEKGQALYVNLANLETDKLIAKSTGKLTVTAYNNGSCYVSVSKSASGKTFWKDSITNKVQELTSSSTSTCGAIPGATTPAVTTMRGSIGQVQARSTDGTNLDGYTIFWDNENSNSDFPSAYGNIPALAAYEGQKSGSISLPVSNLYIENVATGKKNYYTGTGTFSAVTNAQGKIYNIAIEATSGSYFRIASGSTFGSNDGDYLHFTINGVDQKIVFLGAPE